MDIWILGYSTGFTRPYSGCLLFYSAPSSPSITNSSYLQLRFRLHLLDFNSLFTRSTLSYLTPVGQLLLVNSFWPTDRTPSGSALLDQLFFFNTLGHLLGSTPLFTHQTALDFPLPFYVAPSLHLQLTQPRKSRTHTSRICCMTSVRGLTRSFVSD